MVAPSSISPVQCQANANASSTCLTLLALCFRRALQIGWRFTFWTIASIWSSWPMATVLSGCSSSVDSIASANCSTNWTVTRIQLGTGLSLLSSSRREQVRNRRARWRTAATNACLDTPNVSVGRRSQKIKYSHRVPLKM